MAVHSIVRTRSDSFDALSASLAGELIRPEHHEYEAARTVWNGMIDKRPAAIARCANADDVALAVRFAAEHEFPLAVVPGSSMRQVTGSVSGQLTLEDFGRAARLNGYLQAIVGFGLFCVVWFRRSWRPKLR